MSCRSNCFETLNLCLNKITTMIYMTILLISSVLCSNLSDALFSTNSLALLAFMDPLDV